MGAGAIRNHPGPLRSGLGRWDGGGVDRPRPTGQLRQRARGRAGAAHGRRLHRPGGRFFGRPAQPGGAGPGASARAVPDGQQLRLSTHPGRGVHRGARRAGRPRRRHGPRLPERHQLRGATGRGPRSRPRHRRVGVRDPLLRLRGGREPFPREPLRRHRCLILEAGRGVPGRADVRAPPRQALPRGLGVPAVCLHGREGLRHHRGHG